MKRIAVAFAVLLALPARPAPQSAPARPAELGLPSGAPLSGPALDAQTNDVAALLRCPVCQGLSVSDSPSSMARNMKAEVREKLAAGYDRDQILAYFERSYGEFVRLQPSMRGVNWLVWFGPVLGLAGGAAVIAWKLKRPQREPSGSSPAGDVPSRDTLPPDPRLAAAVRRVRELAYGWADGVPPKRESPG